MTDPATETDTAPDGETTVTKRYPAKKGFNVVEYLHQVTCEHIRALNEQTEIPAMDMVSGLTARFVEQMAFALVAAAPDDTKAFEAQNDYRKFLLEQADRGFGQGMELRESLSAVEANLDKVRAAVGPDGVVDPEMIAELRAGRAS